MSFSAQLRKKAYTIWQKEKEHPFVVGLATGELPQEKFRYYMCQDYAYLIAYSRVFALGAAKAESLQMMTLFANLLAATLNEEMSLHRQYAAQFGITSEELEQTQMAPTAYAYSRHLLATAYEGGLAEILAAILPCQWGYHEIALHLRDSYPGWEGSPYAEWIRTYTSDSFGQLGAVIREELDRVAEGLGAEGRARLEEIFLTSSRYELRFWQMAYTQEGWD